MNTVLVLIFDSGRSPKLKKSGDSYQLVFRLYIVHFALKGQKVEVFKKISECTD